MKIGFKYHDRISMYVFDNDPEKHSMHQTVFVDESYVTSTDSIIIDVWKDATDLERYKKVMSTKKDLFAKLYAQEIFVEMYVCKQTKSEDRTNIGRLSAVYDWLIGRVDSLLPTDKDMMQHIGECVYNDLRKDHADMSN